MAKIISFANQKGGVGKSTSTINTGAFLAAYGKRVLIVDTDPQANATSGLGVDPASREHHLYHVLIDDTPVAHGVCNTSVMGLDILPAHSSLAGATVELVPKARREFRLYDALTTIRTDYDYILIDSPPSLGLLTVNALAAADHIIIPVQCEYYALEGLGQLLQTIELIKQNLGRDTEVMGAVLTLFDRRNKLNRRVVVEMEKNFPGHVFNAIVPRCIRLAEAPSYGKSILHYDPKSKGAKAYRQLAAEIMELA